MNFKITLLTAAFALLFSYSFGQEGILIKNTKSNKSIFYKRSSIITYATKQDYQYVKGRINSVNDSSFVVNGIRVSLKEIYSIQRKNKFHKAMRIAGIPFLFLGCVISGNGIANIIIQPESENGKNALLAGLGFLAIGYTPYFINLREYVVDDKNGWKIETVSSKK